MNAVLHALHEPRRREILRRTWTAEVSAGELHRGFGDITFGAVSQHLRVLSEAGLVDCRRAGRHRYYRARHRELGPLRTWLEQMWSRSLADLAALAEDEERTTRREPNRSIPVRRAARNEITLRRGSPSRGPAR
jgi:DNA-binding transcriptional ArsR family regulator